LIRKPFSHGPGTHDHDAKRRVKGLKTGPVSKGRARVLSLR
jgi:hypothetical protein